MQNETGVISNFYKQLLKEENKNKVMKAFFPYILERKPETKDFVMLQKLIKDFDHFIVFDALVALRYSNVDMSNYFGYLVSICKNLLKETVTDNTDNIQAQRTDEMLNTLRTRIKNVSK